MKRRKILRIAGFTLGAVVLTGVGALCALTWYLTPQRLTEIVNREASRELNADVTAHNIRFTVWSTFPHFTLAVDSLRVRSRALDSIPPSLRAKLPKDADFLLSTGSITGGINLLKLLHQEISLSDLNVERLNLNLVSVSDSLANYYIFPSGGGPDHIPYFTTNRASLSHPGTLRYRSLQDGADISVPLHEMALIRCKSRYKDCDSYDLSFAGMVNAAVDGLSILKGFPVSLNGDIALGFKPFSLRTENYEVALGTLRGHVNMNMNLGDSGSLDSFSYRLNNFNLARLLESIPGLGISQGATFEADINLAASARLTGPWQLSSSVLPSAEVEFEALEGPIAFSLADGRRFAFSHSGAKGILHFNGNTPETSYFEILPFTLSGEGADLSFEARADELFGTPKVAGTVSAMGSIPEFLAGAPLFLSLNDFRINSGRIDVSSQFSFSIPPLASLSSGSLANSTANLLSDFLMSGDVSVTDFRGSMPKEELSISLPKADLSFTADIASLASPMKGGVSLRIPDVALTSGRGKGSASVKAGGIHVDGDLTMNSTAGEDNFNVKTTIAKASASTADGLKANLGKLAATFSARTRRQAAPGDYRMGDHWMADSASLARIPHSAAFLMPNLGAKAKKLLTSWEPKASLQVDSAYVSSPAFPMAASLSGVSASASAEGVTLNSLTARCGISRLTARGRVSGLRQWLFSQTPAPLYVTAMVEGDTLQINQLARAYESMHPYSKAEDSGGKAQKESDTIAGLLPRNLMLDLHAAVKETRYMSLHLYDLMADVYAGNGNLKADPIRVSSDFGSAAAELTYRSADIQDMGLQLDLSLDTLNIVSFFHHFHALQEMMPEMANLSGTIGAQAAFSVEAFPNMYLNVPSFHGNLFLQGRELTIKQSPFIRRVTRHLMIRNEGPLHLANVDVHATVHSDLLELYPFTIEMEDYRLRVMGVNNFNGDMYYHLGVEKWPLRIPFGLNIEGTFSHPKLRFGGAGYRVKDTQRITENILGVHRFNLVAMGRDFLRKFIHAAAGGKD